MAEITPEKFDEIHDEHNQKVLLSDFNQYEYANEIYIKFVEGLKKLDPSFAFHSFRKSIALTPWKFLKWAMENKIAFKKRFLDALPLHLHELLPEFSPENITIRTTPNWHREHHKAIYLKKAKEIIQNSKKRMTRKELYKHPELVLLRVSFKDQEWKRVIYKERTITDSWLKEVDPRSRGRPPKKKAS